MKKLFSISVVLLFIFAITFTSCQKQNLQQNSVNEQTTLTKVLNFKHKVENPTSKNNDLMSVDSAVWYIEALLNYNYCIVKDSFAVTYSTREDSLNFEITSGTITTQEAIDIYFEIEAKVIELMNKGLKSNLVDVYVKNNKLFYLQVLEQPIQGKPTPIGGFNGFTEPEYYYNADELITSAVNNRIKVTTPYGFYTDIETIELVSVYGGGYDLRNYASDLMYFEYYYLFYENEGNDPTGHNSGILTVDEMNFYYGGAFNTADIVKGYFGIAESKRFKNIYLQDGISLIKNKGIIMHFADITYANFNAIPDPTPIN